VAEGIEDFQVVFWLDLDGDGQVGGGEILGDGSGANDYSSTDTDIATLREMRFNLVARTRNEDRNLEGKFQAKENRNPSITTDGYRRRVHTSHIRIRNLGARVGS
jgi:hypothetical protein